MLTSLKNPLIKEIRKLHLAKERRKQGLFLLEGTNLIESVCRISCPLVTFCCTVEWQERHPELWEKASYLAERVELVSPEVLKAIATTVNPDGVVATAERPESKLSIKSDFNLGIALERLQDPGNLGTIIRTSVATQVDGLWLTQDSVDLDNPKVLRSSAGEWFRLHTGVTDNLRQVVNNYQQQGVQVIATSPQATKTYWQINFTKPTLILLGNEGAGLSPELAALADEQVQIPLQGGVESLNVAIAAALLLYEAQRQRTFAGSN